MSGSDFQFRFYVRDWYSGTRAMTLEERGMYIDLLSLIREHGGRFEMPPEDDFCRVLALDPRVLRRVFAKLVMRKKIEVKDGYITNPRTDRDRGEGAGDGEDEGDDGPRGGTSRGSRGDVSRKSGAGSREVSGTSRESSAKVGTGTQSNQRVVRLPSRPSPSQSRDLSTERETRSRGAPGARSGGGGFPVGIDWPKIVERMEKHGVERLAAWEIAMAIGEDVAVAKRLQGAMRKAEERNRKAFTSIMTIAAEVAAAAKKRGVA